MPKSSTISHLRTLLLGAGAMSLLVALAIWLLGGKDTPRPGAPERASANANASTNEPEEGSTQARESNRARVQLEGKVRSSKGEAIADAVVTLVALDRDGDGEGPQTTRSDDAGAWSFGELAQGRYALSATATGYLADVKPMLELRSEGTTNVILQLEAGGTRLSGTVADETGGVIEGALVRVTPQAGIAQMRERESYFTLTDDQGDYVLQVPSGRARVGASHVDYTNESVVLEIAAGELRQDFALLPTAVLEGVVVRESDAAPVPGAEVSWARERMMVLPEGGRINTVERGGRVIADAAGRFRISSLPPGLVVLSARASMLASSDPLQVPVGIAERVEGVELRLAAASDVSGRVIAAGAGQGIADAHVELMSPAGPGAGARTDAEGHFRIVGVLPGDYRALARAEGWWPSSGSPASVRVGGEPSSIVLELERGLTIRGRVEPALAAEVAIELRPESVGMGMGAGLLELGGARATQSAADTGGFELGPLAQGHYTLEARAADGRGGTVEVDVGPDGASEVVIALEQRAVLSGHVEDFNGKRIADVAVRARKRSAGRSLSVVVNGQELAALSSPTSTQGIFELAGLAAGAWQIEVVDAQGDLLNLDVGGRLELELAGAERRELVLRVEPRDGSISGVVHDAEGEPVADAWVSAAFVPALAAAGKPEPGEGSHMEMRMVMIADDGSGTLRTLPPTLTDAQGRFAFAELRRGEYTLTAEFEGGASKATREHVRPNAEVKLELAPLGAIEGTVSNNGRPANCIARLSGPTPRAVRVRDGKFAVERLEPGRYTVEASSIDGSKSESVEVQAGSTATLELALERLSRITGTIVDESGSALAGVEILVGAGEGGRIEISREDSDPVILTDDAGKFEVRAAAGGRVLLAQEPGSPMPIVVKPFVVSSGQDLDLGELRKQALADMMMMGGPEEQSPGGSPARPE